MHFICNFIAVLPLLLNIETVTTMSSRRKNVAIPINETTAASKAVSQFSPMPKWAVPSSFNSSSRRPIITVLTSVNYGGSYYFGGPLSTKSMEILLDLVRSQPDWLPDYELAFELVDDECTADVGIRRLVDKLRDDNPTPNRLPLIRIASCEDLSERVSAMVTKEFNLFSTALIQIHPELFYKRQLYSYFYPPGDQGDMIHIGLVEFVRQMGWRKVAVISQLWSYYDMIDRYLVDALDRRNVSLVWMGKVTWRSENEEELSNTVAEMKARNPRIIISHYDSVPLACWLHRYGMYGPSYVVLGPTWNDYSPESAEIPAFLASWCTRKMLFEVFPSFISFGWRPIMDEIVDSKHDNASSRLTMLQYFKLLHEKIPDSVENGDWATTAPICYDGNIFVAYWVNEIAKIVHARNESLLDWTVDSENYRTRSSEMIAMMKEALYRTKVTGLLGQYQIDPKTGLALGFMPIAFNQVQIKESGSNSSMPLIAYYKSNENRIINLRPAQWRTIDGLPPRDSQVILMVNLAPFSDAILSSLMTVGAVEIVLLIFLCSTACFIMPIIPAQMERFSKVDVVIFIGDIVMILHVFVIPNNSSLTSIAANCEAIVIVIATGYSMAFCGLLTKLELGLVAAESSAMYSNVPRNSSVIIGTGSSKHFLVIAVFWLITQASLLGALFDLVPIQVATVYLDFKVDSKDPSIALQFATKECQFPNSLLHQPSTIIILAILAFLQLCFHLRAIFLSYILRTQLKQRISLETKNACNCVYCVGVVLLASVVIALIGGSSGRYVQILASCFTIVISLITGTIVTIGKANSSTDTSAPAVGSNHPLHLFNLQSKSKMMTASTARLKTRVGDGRLENCDN